METPTNLGPLRISVLQFMLFERGRRGESAKTMMMRPETLELLLGSLRKVACTRDYGYFVPNADKRDAIAALNTTRMVQLTIQLPVSFFPFRLDALCPFSF